MGVSTTRKPFIRKKKSCPLSGPNAPKIDYKIVSLELLRKYMSKGHRIMPSRITGICLKKQRELRVAINRAQFLGLMLYAGQNKIV